jgi:hypothetical protein
MTDSELTPAETSHRVTRGTFRELAKGFKKTFEGYEDIQSMFIPLPIKEGRTPPQELATSNGNYTIERNEYESDKFLEIVVTRAPLLGDNSFESETVTLTEGEDEKRKKIVIIKYVKKNKLRQAGKDVGGSDADKTSDRLVDLPPVPEVRLDGLVAVPAIREFIEGIRKVNPSTVKKLARRGSI